MELLQLRYFCVVAKHQNMTKAAAELMISQPALSKTIASLEKELGTPLFVRRNRSIFLNRAGEILYQKIDQSINLIDDTVSEIRELSNEPFGNVRLLVLSASSYMPGFYIAFHQRYPFIKLQLSNYIRYEHMFMYDCDFCITADAGFTPLAGNCGSPEAASTGGPRVHPPKGSRPLSLCGLQPQGGPGILLPEGRIPPKYHCGMRQWDHL